MGTGEASTTGARRTALGALHLLALLIVVAGVASQLVRPLAPHIGDLPDATRWFDAEHLARVEAYWAPVRLASVLTLVLRVAIPVLVVVTPAGRRVVDRVVARVGTHRPLLAAAAVALAVVVGVDLLLFPVAFWAGYLHETAYGFRTSGVGGWLYDWAAARVPGWVGVAALVSGGYWVARRLPQAWVPVTAVLGAAVTALVVMLSPVLLEPLRFRMTPLGDGAVRGEVEAAVRASGLEVDRILVADASRRTTRQNAYVSGLGGTRRIVLYDTLIDERPVDEVAMVVAHELGHELHRDLERGTLAGMAGTVVVVYVLGAALRWRVRRGRADSVIDPRGAAAAVALVVVLNAVTMPVQSALSRRTEAAADLAALNLTEDPATFGRMNLELSLTNLSDPAPPAWVRVLWSSHPPTVARLTMGERWPFERGPDPSDGADPG